MDLVNIINDIRYALIPELIIVMSILIITVLSFVLSKDKSEKIFYIAFGVIILALISYGVVGTKDIYFAFYHSFLSDSLSILSGFLILVGGVITLLLSKKYLTLSSNYKGEYYAILLCAMLGAMLLCGANDLIMLFIALETLSISSYILSGFTRDDKLTNEAALKYLVIGGTSTAILLYGFSLLYGIVGDTNFINISQYLYGVSPNPVTVLAMTMILGGLFFKISAVPFHVWTPDVYSGSPVPVAAFLSVVSKIAGFTIILRLLSYTLESPLIVAILLSLTAVATMFIGNIGAVTQTNLRRLMAYSSIAQAGYILTGLAVYSKLGASSSLFYLIGYLFMNFGAWAGIEIFINKIGKENIEDMNGLIYMSPPLAIGITICLLSLAGMPLTAGFWGKLYLFKSILFAGIYFIPLLIITLINTVIGLYYYTKVIKAMYVKPPNKQYLKLNILDKSLSLNTALLLCSILVIFIGFVASPFITCAQDTVLKTYGMLKAQAYHRLNHIQEN